MEQAQDFGFACGDAIRCGLRAASDEGGGVDGFDGEPLAGEEGVDDGELVVDFVGGVGVEHHADGAVGGRAGAGDTLCVVQRGEAGVGHIAVLAKIVPLRERRQLGNRRNQHEARRVHLRYGPGH